MLVCQFDRRFLSVWQNLVDKNKIIHRHAANPALAQGKKVGTEIIRRRRQRGRPQRLVQLLHHVGDALLNPTDDSGSAKLPTDSGGFPASIYYRCFEGNSVHLRPAVTDLVRDKNKIGK